MVASERSLTAPSPPQPRACAACSGQVPGSDPKMGPRLQSQPTLSPACDKPQGSIGGAWTAGTQRQDTPAFTQLQTLNLGGHKPSSRRQSRASWRATPALHVSSGLRSHTLHMSQKNTEVKTRSHRAVTTVKHY